MLEMQRACRSCSYAAEQSCGSVPHWRVPVSILSKFLVLLCALVGISTRLHTAYAWPDRPVTFVVPNPAGGSTDILARYIAQHLSATLGVNFVVENRPGASGAIGAGSVARASPDGYTFLFGTTGQL